jgi:hypothetical protein
MQVESRAQRWERRLDKLDWFYNEIVARTNVTSAGASRAGNLIQVRLSIPDTRVNSPTKTRVQTVTFGTEHFLNVDWENLSGNRRNEVIAITFHAFYHKHGGGAVNFQTTKDNKHLLELARKIHGEAISFYRRGTFKRVVSSHKLNRARKLIRENLLWALREGLPEKEIRKLLKEALCADLIDS